MSGRKRLASVSLSGQSKSNMLRSVSVLPHTLKIRPSVGSVAQAFLAVGAVILGVLLLYVLRNVIILFLLSLFIAAVIDPGVQFLRRWGIPVSMGVLIHYFVFFSIFFFLLISLIPILAEQLSSLTILANTELNRFFADPSLTLPLLSPEANARVTQLLQATLNQLSIEQVPDLLTKLSENLSTVTSNSLQITASIAGSVVRFFIGLIVVLVLTFLIELERGAAFSWLRMFFPRRYWPYIDHKSIQIYERLGQWAKGQLMLCLCIGSLVFIMLLILGVPYALTLAMLAGFTEFIPYVGPFIAAVPAILITTANDGPVWGLIVAGSFYAIQWSENNLIVPVIMRHAVNLSAVAIVFGMLIGISFPTIIHPVLGLLLSIPTMSIIALFLEDVRSSVGKTAAAHEQ